jgi:hypothetical protein
MSFEAQSIMFVENASPADIVRTDAVFRANAEGGSSDNLVVGSNVEAPDEKTVNSISIVTAERIVNSSIAKFSKSLFFIKLTKKVQAYAKQIVDANVADHAIRLLDNAITSENTKAQNRHAQQPPSFMMSKRFSGTPMYNRIIKPKFDNRVVTALTQLRDEVTALQASTTQHLPSTYNNSTSFSEKFT